MRVVCAGKLQACARLWRTEVDEMTAILELTSLWERQAVYTEERLESVRRGSLSTTAFSRVLGLSLLATHHPALGTEVPPHPFWG